MAMRRAVTFPSECGVLQVAAAVASAMTASTTRQAGGASTVARDTDATWLDPWTRLKPAHVRENQELFNMCSVHINCKKSSPDTLSHLKSNSFHLTLLNRERCFIRCNQMLKSVIIYNHNKIGLGLWNIIHSL